MGVLGKFESKVEGAVDGAAAAMFASPIEPAQIAKKAEKQMKKEKLVGSGRQYAPTLYNVLVNERDDKRLFGFYPTMASEIENYLYARGTDAGMEFDTRPLVRFIPDPGLKKGRFDVIAEVVSAPIIKKLRAEEQEYYGLAPQGSAAAAEQELQAQDAGGDVAARGATPRGERARPQGGIPLPASSVSTPSGIPPAVSPAPVSSRFAGLDVSVDVDDAAGEFSVLGNAMLYNLVEQRPHRLESRELTLGRGKDNNITLADANASRVHAKLSQDATGKWKLTDLGSTNGTQLNGRDVTSAILKSGDEITIGTTVLQFTE